MMCLPIGLLVMKTPRIQDFDPNAKVPELGSPMEHLPAIQQPAEKHIASKLVNQQGSLLVEKQTSKEVKKQTSELAKLQASKEANQQGSKLLKKFGSYLPPETIKALKRYAFENERKEYEILKDAIDFYLDHKKQKR